MEKTIKKNIYTYIHIYSICISESLCSTAEINTTLQINYTSNKKRILKWGAYPTLAEWAHYNH